jgi:hypothetical protein
MEIETVNKFISFVDYLTEKIKKDNYYIDSKLNIYKIVGKHLWVLDILEEVGSIILYQHISTDNMEFVNYVKPICEEYMKFSKTTVKITYVNHINI